MRSRELANVEPGGAPAAALRARAIEAVREAVRASSTQDLPDLMAELERIRAEALLGGAAADPKEPGRVLTPTEAAQRLGKGPDWAYRNRHSLPTIRLPGGRWGVPEDRLESWIRRRAV